MFSNCYQGGGSVEVWDCKVTPDRNVFYRHLCRLPNKSVSFDREAKTYVCELAAQNASVQLPAESNKYLGLTQGFLVLQVFVPLGQHWSLLLVISDLMNAKRRLNLTTHAEKLEGKFFSCRCPLDGLPKGQWLFLGVDLVSFMPAFEQGNYKSLDQIVVGSPCRIRRIFTLREFSQTGIPKHYWLAQDIPQQLYLIKFGQPVQNSVEVREQVAVRPKLSKLSSQNRSAVTMKREQSKTKALQKSDVIIQKAKHRISFLQKQEQKILNRSKQLQKIPIKSQPFIRTPIPPIKHIKEERIKSKLPFLSKNFQEDVLKEEDESSNMTESRQIAPIRQENDWSDNELDFPRPVQPATPLKNAVPTTITRHNNNSIQSKSPPPRREELQLIFDEMVGCYYHPESNRYFQLR